MKETENKSAETRKKLMDATRDLVVKNGWSAISNRAIAQRSGVNMALINYHFVGQKNLLAATVDRSVATMLEQCFPVTEDISLGEYFRETLRSLPKLLDEPDSKLLILAMLESIFDEDIRTSVHRNLEFWRDHTLKVAQANGVPQSEIRGLVILLAAAIDGLILHLMIDPETDLVAAGRAMEKLFPGRGN